MIAEFVLGRTGSNLLPVVGGSFWVKEKVNPEGHGCGGAEGGDDHGEDFLDEKFHDWIRVSG